MAGNPLDIRGMAPLIPVFDMATSLRFYRDTLGFELTQTSVEPQRPENYHWVLLELNGMQLMLESIYEEDQQPVERGAAPRNNDMVLYFGSPDIEALYMQLKEKGLELDKPIKTGYGFKALYLRDPDGFLLVFHWPEAES
ncbi:VOC family protein [Chitinophaga barathri]|uniref:VOC family protein n=1 Tax=Chitinophaga barathri TaxID=1647451 RepID=A0A3N4ME87_9BACT|nr:VOC family protein [Chitinophaga barathri]RPD42282.1 VOC family protein [Chitinophaga barathri]